MIVSHKHKFIFVKSRKTAGTSLEIGLSQYCGPDDIITPISPEDELIRKELGFRGPQNFRVPISKYGPRDYLRACLGRWPEFYNHMPAKEIVRLLGPQIWNEYFTFTIEREPFGKAISRYYWSTSEPRESIEEYLCTAPVSLISNWETYAINDRPAVDMVIRYEHLNDDLAVLQSQLGLGEVVMPKAKGTYRKDRSHYSQILNPAARNRIEIVCAREIRYFGYKWDEERSDVSVDGADKSHISLTSSDRVSAPCQ